MKEPQSENKCKCKDRPLWAFNPVTLHVYCIRCLQNNDDMNQLVLDLYKRGHSDGQTSLKLAIKNLLGIS